MSDWIARMQAEQERTFRSIAEGKCGCLACIEQRGESALHMVLCPQCGNKRCPRASSHEQSCTGSNEPGQKGSVYE